EFIRTSEIIKLENSDIQNQFNQYRNESENIINQLKSDHETQLNQYKNESENIINQLKSDHETEFGHYKNESLAKNSRYEDEISNLKSGLEKKLSENNQNWEEKYNSLLEKKSGTENEFRELENSFKALSSELVENKNSVIQKEEMIAGLEIEIQKLTESSKNSIQEQAALKKDFDDEISALNELHNEEKEHLQKKQDELLNRLESGKEKISILESQINQLEHTISENTDNFENSLKEKENQLQAQKVESSELAENLKNQINHEKEDKQNQIKEFEQITRNKDSEIEGLRHTINESNTAIQKLESNIEIARQKIHELENEREDLREQKESQQRTIAEQEINADSLKDQINSLHKDIDNLKEQITLQKSKEQKLNSEISSRNENIRNLENSLNNAKNEKLTLNSDIARLNEGLAISKQEIEELTLEIHNRKKEISELQNHERKLIEELNHAVEREKGSTEKGRLLEKILQSLTSTPDLHELLETVKGYLAEILPVDRMTIFSLHNESNLIIESVIENDTSLKQLAGTVISLSETQFGQTLAAQKSSIFNKNNSSENTDLPGVLENQEFAKTLSCAVIPLAVTGKTIGILTIASGLNDNFNENNIQIYSSLSPLISRTLMYHLNNLELQKSRKDRISTEKIEKFIAHKFKNIVSRIQNIQEQESYEVIPDIFSSFPDNKKSENDFKVWIETISEIIKKRLSAKISVNLDSHALRSLKNNTGINYELLFWYIAEAGDNTILHSDANAVEISLNEDSNFVALIYSDNGEGLTRTAGSETPEKGTGLDAIKEIIELSGGTFHKSKRPDSYGLELKAVWKKSSSM
ncbi:MAG: hypothetical protein OEZ34_14300, partial [Spirochaetia bacterium]|nr:hypothetical protein [Spirochaetia bacterium]